LGGELHPRNCEVFIIGNKKGSGEVQNNGVTKEFSKSRFLMGGRLNLFFQKGNHGFWLGRVVCGGGEITVKWRTEVVGAK